MVYPVLASSSTLAIPEGINLFAGSGEVDTARAVAAAAITQYQIVALNAAGGLVPWDDAAEDESGTAVGIAAVAGASGDGVPYYIEGDFNHEALVWPAAVATYEARKAAFVRTPVNISTVLKSGQAQSL